jgi:hypothetical protein
VHQQPAVARRVVILAVAMRILADVRVEQPELAFASHRVGVLQIDAPFAGRFDFGPEQFDSRFEGFEYVVVVIGLAVGRNYFVSLCLRSHQK